ncbi:TIGR02677 family protein [Pradoshia eiseniae]|nr:TIGR02677 family protein [Pradoshia eiseniae]
MKYPLDTVNLLKYATTENSYRYRPIIRFLYEQYERFKYYSRTEEIFRFLKENKLVEDTYKESDLYEDLRRLEAWECVISRRDKELIFYTIEEFKNKRLKYQITQPVFEIENTLKKLDELEDELTGALESREFERILKGVNKLMEVDLDNASNEILYENWMVLMNSLENLKRNSANYLSYLKSEKAEQLFKTEEFLLFKEKFVDYLSKFILTMNRNKHKIAKMISGIEQSYIDRYIQRLVDYFASIPTLDGQKFNREKSTRLQTERWLELRNWFISSGDNVRDVDVLLKETEVSIQMISRYALRLSEMKGNNKNRKDDYLALATMFNQCEHIDDAHHLAAACFGVHHTKHLFGIEKLTDTQNEEIWEQNQPTFVTAPKSKAYQRNKRIKSYVKASTEEKQIKKEQVRDNRKKERQMIASLIVDQKIVLKDLGIVEPFVRKSILTWISRGAQNKRRTGKTDFGESFSFYKASDQKIKLKCTDGVMEMPDLIFEFETGD